MMKRFAVFMIISMLISMITIDSAFASGDTSSIAKAGLFSQGVVEQKKQDKNEEGQAEGYSSQEEAGFTVPADGTRANCSIFVDDNERLLYTCSVRKTDVYVKFQNSEGPTQVDVRLEILENGSWTNFQTQLVGLGSSACFGLTIPFRYRIYVRKKSGMAGNCSFVITALP